MLVPHPVLHGLPFSHIPEPNLPVLAGGNKIESIFENLKIIHKTGTRAETDFRLSLEVEDTEIKSTAVAKRN